MPKIILTRNERDWMKENYPDLHFVTKEEDEWILGTLSFDMVYYNEDSSHVIKPAPKHLTHGERITDSYEIRILLEKDPRSVLPLVWESGKRIKRVAQSMGRSLLEMHQYTSGCCCLALDHEENRLLPNGFNLPDFFHNVLIPYFFAQSYFEKNHYWKWGERTHSFSAYFEWYAEQSKTEKKDVVEIISRMRSRDFLDPVSELLEMSEVEVERIPCLCGNPTGKMLKNCHPNVLVGFLRLKQDMEKYGISLSM